MTQTVQSTECVIYERAGPLTYLIRVQKKEYSDVMLNSVAWLCRCVQDILDSRCSVSVVRLAKEYYMVDLLLKREDIQGWNSDI
ncbi:hypothetical protein BKA93DRAFT_728320 [Sparassis latifolia]